MPGVPFEEVFLSFSPERQERIKKRAAKLIEKYKTLQEFRKAIGLTQEEVADKMGVKQVNVSQLEHRDDMHISTLRKYVEALGGELQISIRMRSDSEEALEEHG